MLSCLRHTDLGNLKQKSKNPFTGLNMIELNKLVSNLHV